MSFSILRCGAIFETRETATLEFASVMRIRDHEHLVVIA
jgi:hypothetical protein